ncbi:MAG: kynureninase [Chitinophagaceae bacterium]|nr:MAG: kynureninase [Chitinophagaceae bacterium]
MEFAFEKNFAEEADKKDELKSFREQFYIPKIQQKDALYFCGNSLGLQPKTVDIHLQQELKDWKELGVEGHFEAKNPWFYYHHFLTPGLTELLGAKKSEVAAMNALSVNLHLLMVSFYNPGKNKFKVLTDTPIFPSDRFAIQSQADFHGYENALLEVDISNCNGSEANEKIIQNILKHKDELALILLSGVNYYSGHYYDHKKISEVASANNITFGLDLAHAIGNVPLKLNEWDVDFATWCSYKYLNSGPGGCSGIFVHEKHHENNQLKRFNGWWGTDEETRFKMEKQFVPQKGAGAWQLSNAPVLSMAAQKASLEIFQKAGILKLRKKSEQLTAYMAFIITETERKFSGKFNLITPPEKESRGCQLSILAKDRGREIFDEMKKGGLIADWREPDVIRLAPVPLYNSFSDVYQFGVLLNEACHKIYR